MPCFSPLSLHFINGAIEPPLICQTSRFHHKLLTICIFSPWNNALSTVNRYWVSAPHSTFFLFLHAAATFPLPQADVLHWRGEGGSSVRRSSHHLWNFRARPRWKGVLCPLMRNALASLVKEKASFGQEFGGTSRGVGRFSQRWG